VRSSLKDIAAALNLSTTTVSWVLAGKSKEKAISLATSDRVLKCAEELNYQPNFLARSLNSGISHTIGLILPSIGDEFYSMLAKEIELEAEKDGFGLMICSSESELNRENRMIETLRSKQVDGIILAPTKLSNVKIHGFLNDSFPFVLIDRYYPDIDTNYVIIDNEHSSYTLVKHLIEKGHKKIAIITTNPHLFTLNLRCLGYRKALVENGLTVNPDLYGEVGFYNYDQDIVQVLDAIFKKVPDVDGFFFATHILALEAFRYFHKKGIDINNNFGLACIHEVPTFSVLAPKMNIAKMPVQKIGSEAVKILIKEIKAQKIKRSIKNNNGVKVSRNNRSLPKKRFNASL